jgi:hypothetical protein
MNKGVKKSNTEYKGLIDLSDKQSFTHREKLEAKPKKFKVNSSLTLTFPSDPPHIEHGSLY